MPQQVKHQFQSTILGSYNVFSRIGGAADGDVCREDNLHIWLSRSLEFSREGRSNLELESRHAFQFHVPTAYFRFDSAL